LSGQLQQKPAVHFAVVALLSLGGHRGSRLFRCTYEEGHCRWGVVRIPCGNGLLVRSAVVRHARVRDGVTVRLLPTLSGSCARRGTDSDADLDAREALQGDTGLVQDLLDGLLVVERVGLAEQRGVLEEAVEATLDDLRQGGLGLA